LIKPTQPSNNSPTPTPATNTPIKLRSVPS
jgi:hypothetical protein